MHHRHDLDGTVIQCINNNNNNPIFISKLLIDNRYRQSLASATALLLQVRYPAVTMEVSHQTGLRAIDPEPPVVLVYLYASTAHSLSLSLAHLTCR